MCVGTCRPAPRAHHRSRRAVPLRVHEDVDGTDLVGHCSLRCGDALGVRDIHLDGHYAMLIMFSQVSVRAVERRGISSSQHDGKPFREQLASRLESEARFASVTSARRTSPFLTREF